MGWLFRSVVVPRARLNVHKTVTTRRTFPKEQKWSKSVCQAHSRDLERRPINLKFLAFPAFKPLRGTSLLENAVDPGWSISIGMPAPGYRSTIKEKHPRVHLRSTRGSQASTLKREDTIRWNTMNEIPSKDNSRTGRYSTKGARIIRAKEIREEKKIETRTRPNLKRKASDDLERDHFEIHHARRTAMKPFPVSLEAKYMYRRVFDVSPGLRHLYKDLRHIARTAYHLLHYKESKRNRDWAFRYIRELAEGILQSIEEDHMNRNED
ncbi:hypothetical protein PROFUN_07654 [Planoprotostelium fungivorum]|uniref:Uncharacterized protein n=1 Tax=Planoprotostelium fungivorum TaxID=1890364 RepID=A0A2P6NK67_9EUKA|nr:hypothetical protein PROFUN_07654 [Planoprotostelium fungivorum]